MALVEQSAGTRLTLLAGTLVVAAVLVTWIKVEAILFFLANRGSLWGMLAAFVVLAVVATMVLRAPVLPSVVIALVVGLYLLASIANTPLPYELEGVARGIEWPAGGEPPVVEASATRPMAHPQARIIVAYPEGRDVTSLTNETRDALAADGWLVRDVILPGEDVERWGDLGYVSASRDALQLGCTIGEATSSTPTRLLCSLRVP